jgi:predicted kinase
MDPGLSLIADGTFRQEAQRSALRTVARMHGAAFVVIRVTAEERVVLPRLERRLASGGGSGAESYLAARAAYEEPAGDDVICLENGGDLVELEPRVRRLVSRLV